MTRTTEKSGRLLDVTTEKEPKTKNRGFVGAFRRGAMACARGDERDSNPYGAENKYKAPFRRYWFLGYDSAKEEAAS